MIPAMYVHITCNSNHGLWLFRGVYIAISTFNVAVNSILCQCSSMCLSMAHSPYGRCLLWCSLMHGHDLFRGVPVPAVLLPYLWATVPSEVYLLRRELIRVPQSLQGCASCSMDISMATDALRCTCSGVDFPTVTDASRRTCSLMD